MANYKRIVKLEGNAKLYSFKVDTALLDKAKYQARQENRSVSHLIRDAMEFYLRYKEAEPQR